MDTLKVTGVLFCLFAAVSVVAALAQGGTKSGSGAASLGGAAMVLVFGAALYQGVGAVRFLVLACAGLGALGSLVAIALLNTARELQAFAAATLLICLGYFILLMEKQASLLRVVAAIFLVMAGAGASVGTGLWLSGAEKREFAQELRPLLAGGREYADADSGLSLTVPAGWSLLQKDAELFATVPAKVKLADPEAGTVAFLNEEQKPSGLLSLDHYLDGVLKTQEESGLTPKQKARRDTAVGSAPARRMSMGWVHHKRPYSGFVSVWLDGPKVFTLFGAAVGEWSEISEARFQALEASLRFSAPIETALSEAEHRLTRDCPVFSEDAVRRIARKIAPASSSEAYFKTGWSWAIRGQGVINAASAAELRDLMGKVFSLMSEPDRVRFGAYSERLRSGAATTPADDTASMRILGQAASALPPATLERLRTIVISSITAGSLM